MLRRILPLLISALALLASCKDELDIIEDPDAKLEFSTDTLLFDTVFVTVGSTTRHIKVYNRNERAVRISSIELAGIKYNNRSYYRLNIDGIPGPVMENYELAGKDSMFIFVEVTIDPDSLGNALPYIVTDSIIFRTNGNEQKVQLAAYGQNAHFYRDSILPCNTVWTDDLPHVVYNYVAVDTLCNLTIKEGTKIHFHKDAGLFVVGSLNVEGQANDSVIFQGDRLEQYLSDQYGQWYGIQFLRGSTGNAIEYALIKNAIYGVIVGTLPAVSTDPDLYIAHSIIKNMAVTGIFGIKSKVEAVNNLFFNCGQFAFYGAYGGEYTLIYNTIGNYNYHFDRRTPSVLFTDYLNKDLSPLTYSLKANLVNNIIWGSLEDEFAVDAAETTPAIVFDYNLVRSKSSNFPASNIRNQDPKFIEPEKENYRIEKSSPAIKKGLYIFDIPLDIEGKSRSDPPTIGCYETNP